MSSWLARSLANSLRLDQDDDNDNIQNDTVTDSSTTTSPTNQHQQHNNNALRSELEQNQDEEEQYDDDETQGRGGGVKEDLDEIKQTLTRQFWGMASFLAPPPTTISQSDQQQQIVDDAVISNQSSDMENGIVPHPNLNTFGSDSEGEPEQDLHILQSAVGITEEVLTFAMNIAMHPETWLDFPIDEEDDTHDFYMSDVQRDHAMVVERLAPRLAALRIELCPCHMSESYFWKVYFVLLHSRLNKQDSEILSTPQVSYAAVCFGSHTALVIS
ncbi:hypothetical protein TSUD_315840 [Trifolium subterraneum]|uniref:BSD domain-containing protein n=1 Tax=Trifolium subterraneum TaxID=3900 RepID=A0A2Z6NHI7_TRISU|nr:hypothetical protein TSUD_315840 [Trifolium subterraneum]